MAPGKSTHTGQGISFGLLEWQQIRDAGRRPLWSMRMDPRLTGQDAAWGPSSAQGFMRRPGINGLALFVSADANEGTLTYDAGEAMPWLMVLERLGGQAAGVRAGVELCWRAAHILAHAHTKGDAKGVPCHGAMDPSRIFLRSDGQVVLAGYGVAPGRLMAPLSIDAARYAPPERMRGEQEGIAADIFGLAIVAVEAMVGEPVYDAEDDSLDRQVREGMAERRLFHFRRDVPDDVRQVLALALKGDADTRLRDPRVMAARMRELMDSPVVKGQSLRAIATRVFRDTSSEPAAAATKSTSRREEVPQWHAGPGRAAGPWGAEQEEPAEPIDETSEAEPQEPALEDADASESPEPPGVESQEEPPVEEEDPAEQDVVEQAPDDSAEADEEDAVDEVPPPPPLDATQPITLPEEWSDEPHGAEEPPAGSTDEDEEDATAAIEILSNETTPARVTLSDGRVVGFSFDADRTVAENARRLEDDASCFSLNTAGVLEGCWRLVLDGELLDEDEQVGELAEQSGWELVFRPAQTFSVRLVVAGETHTVQVSSAMRVDALEAAVRRAFDGANMPDMLHLGRRRLMGVQVLDGLLYEGAKLVMKP